MKYSIIIPVYNREKTIKICLESLLTTNYKNFEVVVVDDGSSDNSHSVCMDLSKKYSNLHVYTQINKGVSAARNFGISKAQGDYILFVDSDDILHPDTMFYLDEKNTANFDMLVFNYSRILSTSLYNFESIMEKDDVTIHSGNDDVIRWFFEKYTLRGPIHIVGTKAFKKTIISENALFFREDLSLGEDLVFICEYIKHISSLRYLDAAWYFVVSWSRTIRPSGLGSMRRTVTDFLHNQVEIYKSLINLYEHSCLECVKKFAVSYILDRPITRVIFRNSDLLSKQRLSYRQLRNSIDKDIKPILMYEYANVEMLYNKRIKWYVKKIVENSYNKVLFCSYLYNTWNSLIDRCKNCVKTILRFP